LLLTTVPVFGASGDEVGGKLGSVMQAHDPGAQVSAPERSPVGGLFQTSIDGMSGFWARTGGISLSVTCWIWRRGRM
jgi:hypothetical protein